MQPKYDLICFSTDNLNYTIQYTTIQCNAMQSFICQLNPIQTGLFLLPRTGGCSGGPTPVTLQPLMVWLPNLHRTMY